MNRRPWMIAVSLALLVALPTVSSQSHTVMYGPASTTANGGVQMAIPFDFIIGGGTLKAGDYVIAPIGEKQIAVGSTRSQAAETILTNAIDGGIEFAAPRLVFHKYGRKYFLTQVWLSAAEGRELHVSPGEIAMARAYRQERIFLVAKK